MADFESHERCIKRMCRICGCTLTATSNYGVKLNLERLNMAFNVNFSEDVSFIHPVMYCRKCHYRLSNYESRGSSMTLEPITWIAHTDANCETCSKFSAQSRGGRPPKKTKPGRPKCPPKVGENDKNIIDANKILQLTPSKEIPPEVEKLVSHVVSIKMKQSTLPNNTIQLPTKGPQVRNYLYFSEVITV